MKKNTFYASSILLILLLFSCKNSDVTEPNDDKTADGLETKTVKTTSSGGEYFLSDGSGIIIPAGAFNSETEIKITKMDPGKYFTAKDDYSVLNFESQTTTFSKEVEIFIVSPKASSNIQGTGGYFDVEDEILDVSSNEITTKNGKKGVLIKTTHFSPYAGHFWEQVPVSAGPLQVTCYNQGETPYCWATCLQMMTESITPTNDLEVFDWIAATGIDESGAGQGFIYNKVVRDLVKSRTSILPEAQRWPGMSALAMDTYLKHNIALGYPVLVMDPFSEHATLVTGYDGNTFYINDPASMDYTSIGGTAKPWKDFRAEDLGMRDNIVTMVIPAKLKSTKMQSVNFSTSQINFVKPKSDNSPYNVYGIKWAPDAEGYGFYENNAKGVKVDIIPAGISELQLQTELINASLVNSKNVKISVDIWGENNSQKHSSILPPDQISLPPNSLKYFPISIPSSEFLDPAFTSTTYRMLVSVIDNNGGGILDQYTVRFSIEGGVKFKTFSIGGMASVHFENSSNDYFDSPEYDFNYYKIPVSISGLNGTYSNTVGDKQVSGQINISPAGDKVSVTVNFYKYKGADNEVYETYTLSNMPCKISSTGTLNIDLPNLDPSPYISGIDGYAMFWKDYKLTNITFSVFYLALHSD